MNVCYSINAKCFLFLFFSKLEHPSSQLSSEGLKLYEPVNPFHERFSNCERMFLTSSVSLSALPISEMQSSNFLCF